MNLKIWLKAVRLPFLTATLVPVVLGGAIAWHATGQFHWWHFWLTLIGISFLHFGTNMANDYFDHKTKNDELNKTHTPFSGGSRVIQDGEISPERVLFAALLCFSLGSLIGLYLSIVLKSMVILILGIIGVFFGFFYTASPLQIGYKGYGEFIVGLCFGPLVVFGSYVVQAGNFSLVSLWASFPVGLLITLVLYINEFPDYEADKSVNKKTLVVQLGKEKAVKVYYFLLGFVYLYIFLFVAVKRLPPYVLLIILTLPMALKAYKTSQKNFSKITELFPANAMTIGLHLSIGLLLSAGYVLDKIFS